MDTFQKELSLIYREALGKDFNNYFNTEDNEDIPHSNCASFSNVPAGTSRETICHFDHLAKMIDEISDLVKILPDHKAFTERTDKLFDKHTQRKVPVTSAYLEAIR